MISTAQLLLIGLGGGLGSILRVVVAELVPAGRLPWGTVAVNVIGSMLLGWMLSRLGAATAETSHWQAFVVLGFCGGFTTFSSFSWQTLEQLRQGQLGVALVHVLVSVVVCLVATWWGWRLGRG